MKKYKVSSVISIYTNKIIVIYIFSHLFFLLLLENYVIEIKLGSEKSKINKKFQQLILNI